MGIPAGFVFDVYDDRFASVNRVFGGRELPEMVKTAAALTPDRIERLPDHAFAAVITDGSRQLRKYACHDPAHTVLSVGYFLDVADRIPDTARSKIAANLVGMCQRHSIEPPAPLLKLAADPERRLLIRSDGAPIRVPVTERKKELDKRADLSGTKVMPLSAPGSAVGDPEKEREKAKKEKRAGLDPYVSWRGVVPRPTHGAETWGHYALSGQRLPIDTFTQVKEAAAFLEQNLNGIHPRTRRSMAVAIVKRAEDLGVGVGEVVRQYGAPGLNPDDYLSAGAETRQRIWAGTKVGGGAPDLYAMLMEKRASTEPETFAEALCQLDEATGLDRYWGHGIPDPWETVFGKEAEEWSWTDGRNTLSKDQLLKIAADTERVKQKLGEDLAAGLASDPVGIFESLPLDTQQVIAALRGQGE